MINSKSSRFLVFCFCLFLGLATACGTTDSKPEFSMPESLVESTIDIVTSQAESEQMSEPDITKEQEASTMEIIMVGDMLMHTKVMDKGLLEDGSYNFDYLFEHVADKIEAADLALVNQETILGGVELGLSGYPRFNSPFALGDSEVRAGFDLILHATNHALDKGKSGLINCMNFWQQNYPDMSYIGINNSTEAQNNNIFIFTKGDITIAVLNYTYGTNGIEEPEDMPYAVNYLDKDKVVSDLAKADELADFVIVCPHWGTEYKLDVSKYQEKWAKIFLENGVDLVIGTHPHVIEPVEWVSDEEGNKMLVYYSLGNFVNGTSGTGEGVANRMVGGMADIVLEKTEDGEVEIKEYDAIPLVCHWSEDEITTYYLDDYTEEMGENNLIRKQDSSFSYDGCKELVEKVWGDMNEDSDR